MLMNPYLMFDGTCADAFAFYESTLGATVEAMVTYSETPMATDCAPAMKDRIAHARLVVDGEVLMGSDCPPDRFEPQQGVSVHLGFDDLDEARRVFETLSTGGTVCMPFGETFWAHGFGVVTDRFGTSWMVDCMKPMDPVGAA